MKLVGHLAIILSAICVFASTSRAQATNDGNPGAGLTLHAIAKPAAILEVFSNSNNVETLESKSSEARTIRVMLKDPAALSKEAAEGNLFMNRIEILVRFSGFKEETATVLISVSDVDDLVSAETLREGSAPERSEHISKVGIISVSGVRSGARIVRYVGFEVNPETVPASRETRRGASLTYTIVQPIN